MIRPRNIQRIFQCVIWLSIGAIAPWIAQGQIVTVTPNPTSLGEPLKLTIDVGQSTQFGLKPILEANPDLDVYLWTWQPSDPSGGNGSWDDSDPDMLMTHEGGLKYSITFVPSEFYSNAGQLFSTGISCLAKLKNGATLPGFEDFGEAKTEDFNVGVLPKLCEDRMCIFPESRRKDDFVSVTYNHNLDTVMTDLSNDDVFLFVKFRGTDGVFYNYVEPEDLTNASELKMEPVQDRPGFYRLVMLPLDLYGDVLPEGVDLLSIICYPLTPGFTYPSDTTPWNGIYYETSIPLLDCE
jgi:hypothetical protein